MKKKMIALLLLAVISVVMIFVNLGKNQSESKENNNIESNTSNGSGIEESTDDTIEEGEELPNEGDTVDNIIWIKNINFLADKGQSYDRIMALKSKLNSQLKTINKEIYEVNLIEDTYKETDTGYIVQAKADKLNGSINIEYKDYEYIFLIEE